LVGQAFSLPGQAKSPAPPLHGRSPFNPAQGRRRYYSETAVGGADFQPARAGEIACHCTVSSRSIRHHPEALLSRDREGAVRLHYFKGSSILRN